MTSYRQLSSPAKPCPALPVPTSSIQGSSCHRLLRDPSHQEHWDYVSTLEANAPLSWTTEEYRPRKGKVLGKTDTIDAEEESVVHRALPRPATCRSRVLCHVHQAQGSMLGPQEVVTCLVDSPGAGCCWQWAGSSRACSGAGCG